MVPSSHRVTYLRRYMREDPDFLYRYPCLVGIIRPWPVSSMVVALPFEAAALPPPNFLIFLLSCCTTGVRSVEMPGVCVDEVRTTIQDELGVRKLALR